MTPDYRAMCAELLVLAEESISYRAQVDEAVNLIDRARALLAQPEPVELTDKELADAAREALDGYRYATELPYFLHEDSSEYEPFMLAIRAVLAKWGNNAQ
ncbi:MAG: hypothetical protein MUP90_13335 [Gammaproteobacteria bacterium]|nr:hypothetical protein [Gammaproteobacteria bacterium]